MSPFDGTVEPIVLTVCSEERKALDVALACALGGVAPEAAPRLDAASAATARPAPAKARREGFDTGGISCQS
jgi:hypothetical protein